MTTELNNVNIYCYRLQRNPSYCRVAICAENKEKAYEHAQKIKNEYEGFGCDWVIKEDDITNLKDLNFVIAE